MDNSVNPFEKVPFYMTYPMQNMYEAELEYERDMDRVKQLYPQNVAKYQRLVEDRCDELEVLGGRIFDEELDKTMLLKEADSIYESVKETTLESNDKKQYFAMIASCDSRDDNGTCDLIRVLFLNEVYRRRCRFRRNRRWW